MADGYGSSSQDSNSPVPEPPPPPLTQPSQTRTISFSDQRPTTAYQRYFCNCSLGPAATAAAHSNCETSHYHSGYHQNGSYTAGGYSTGYDGRNRLTDEEDSACPALLEREFHSLHRNVPALRRAGIDTSTIRQHFYPDGGWGWIVCGVAFLAHVLTSGFQLSYGLLYLYAMRHLGHEVATETGWLGPASWSVSTISAPIIIALCRRKSTRLTAVVGGLVLALGILFSSFATRLNQVAFSYAIVMGIGATMVRESSTVMLGHYFKKRRQFVEMITMSGEGVGIALFSVILKEGVGKMGWRLGLQAITGFVSFSFFMGLLYRPASLYHPQRRAIQHLKNQRKKVKEKKTHIRQQKPPFIDFSPFKSSTVRMLIIVSSVSALGLYSPIFFMSLHGYQEGYDVQDLVLLQTFLGLSIALGIVSSGSIINKTCRLGYKDIFISTQHICQISVFVTSISMLILSAVFEYRNLCILSWTYGIGLGGYRYTLKMLALERIRTKYFTKAWGFIKGAESIPVLIGVPLTSFLNDASNRYGRAGYYICSAATAISAILMFFVGYSSRQNLSKFSTGNGSITSHCTAMTTECPDLLNRSYTNLARCPTAAVTAADGTSVANTNVNTGTVGSGSGHWFSPYHRTLANGVCGAVNHLYPYYHYCHSSGHRQHQQQQQQQQQCAHHRYHQILHHQHPQSSCSNHFRHNLLNGSGGLTASGGTGTGNASGRNNDLNINSSSGLPSASGCYGGVQCAFNGLGGSSFGVGFGTLPHTGSVGRYQGKRLQKSLSFAFPPRESYGHDCAHGCATNKCYSRSDTPTHHRPTSSLSMYQQYPNQYLQPSRSRSVPEGLSYTSQYCTCPINQQQQQQHHHHQQQQHNTANFYTMNTMGSAAPAATSSSAGPSPYHHRRLSTHQRSSSITRPIQVVEQMTTSV